MACSSCVLAAQDGDDSIDSLNGGSEELMVPLNGRGQERVVVYKCG